MPKEKLLLVGAGGFGRVVSELATLDYDCAFVDDGITINSEICGLKVIGNTSNLKELFTEYKNIVITIGNNEVRKRIYNEAKSIGYTFPNLIHPSAYISPYANIGHGCVVLNNVCIQNGSFVGNCVLLNPGVEIHHDSFVDDFSLIYTNSVVRTYAKVGRCVKIGSNTTICNNAIVDNNTITGDCLAVKLDNN